jgi:hypothetical protein
MKEEIDVEDLTKISEEEKKDSNIDKKRIY